MVVAEGRRRGKWVQGDRSCGRNKMEEGGGALEGAAPGRGVEGREEDKGKGAAGGGKAG